MGHEKFTRVVVVLVVVGSRQGILTALLLLLPGSGVGGVREDGPGRAEAERGARGMPSGRPAQVL